MKILLTTIATILSTVTLAQQVADTLFKPVLSKPMYSKGNGPSVYIDEAHNNFHTRDGRYKPFTYVLEADGYVVDKNTKPFSSESFAKGGILVIANALHESNTTRWTLPTPSAFTDEEITTINRWVKEGGSLFLIADHMPFPGAAEKLAASFGFKFVNGFAVGNDIFKVGAGLHRNIITAGRESSEALESVKTFTGSAFEIPNGAVPILSLNENYKIKSPETAWEFNKRTIVTSGKDLHQGAYLEYGQGKVIVFGEAAMFTAQLQGKNKMGMNSKDASQNLQLLLNILHWLSM
ncbi:DUF4350 domain-containing protein [Pseudochryseolinea flava]|uniref:DUF4350 domain-containing protein n=1 Tax=Pseudochryseolinea flava TaxID=2059302 RepID=A0A364Y3I1_9BACT|nr:DUF4350 domain-containing protein [Pseudochryseolinea flava]RAW00346.1 DUF4350 domain-containing protein [Pseudochryseolinea flava]